MAQAGSMSIGWWEATRGESHRCAKLTDERVREILRANDADRDREFADKFGVSVVTVQMVRNRRRWKHVTLDGETDGTVR